MTKQTRIIMRAIVALFTLLIIGQRIAKRLEEEEMFTIARSNIRQIYTALEIYAGYHDGHLPAGVTSNTVFRELFKTQIIDRENVFSALFSSHQAGGNIGTPPEYTKAVEPGENYWMLLRHPDAFSTEIKGPLLVESPDMSTGIPLWHPELAGTDKPGRTWPGGRAVACFTNGLILTCKTADANKPTSRLQNRFGTIIDFSKLDVPLLPVE